MSGPAESVFASTIDKTNALLKQIELAYGWPTERRHQPYAALRAVLHALRDRLTIQEAAQLAAQLPTLVRGIYYEGWEPSEVPVKMNRDEFLERIRREFRYDVDGGVERLVQTVLSPLQRHFTAGEWDDIRSSMPKDVASILT